MKCQHFLTPPQYTNSQNPMISFDYSWFLAKKNSNFVFLLENSTTCIAIDEAKNIYEIVCHNFWRWRKCGSVEKNVWKYWRDDQTNFAFNLPLCQRQGKFFDSTRMWPTEAVFYRSARTEQNKSIKVLFPEPKPNRTEHVKSAKKTLDLCRSNKQMNNFKLISCEA